MTDLVRQAAVVVGLALMLWTNLAGGGRVDPGRGPEMVTAYPTAFAPAPLTFAIWAPIFLGCLALTVCQALPSAAADPRFRVLGWLVAVAFLLTAATAFTPIGASNVAITLLVVVLAAAYREAAGAVPQSPAFVWCVRRPLAIFLAWCVVATILNGCQLAVSLGRPVGPVPAAALVLLATALGVWGVIRFREPAFAVVLVWASWGIVAARPEEAVLIGAAVAGTLALAWAVVW